MNKTLIATTLTAAFTMLPMAQTATAAAVTYPGMMCELYSSGNPTIDSNGHVENPSVVTQTLICPVASDPTIETTVSPSVFVTDRHYSSNVCCSSRAKNTGSSLWFSSNACSSGSSTSSQGLTPTPPSTNYTYTHRFYQCSLPPVYSGNRSEIRTYRY